MKRKEAVILPGSYDPVTLGHLRMIERASEEYEEVYAVIFVNPEKSYRYSLSDRMNMLLLACDELDNVLVSYSNGLVIDYMREHGIKKIIKGYRNEADLAYEKEMAAWNLKNGGYETELWRAEQKYEKISSTVAREMIEGGELSPEVLPKKVIEFLSKH